MKQSFSDSLSGLLKTLARLFGREVTEGHIDAKLDRRWVLWLVLCAVALVVIVLSFVSMKSFFMRFVVVVCMGVGLLLLIRRYRAGSSEEEM